VSAPADRQEPRSGSNLAAPHLHPRFTPEPHRRPEDRSPRLLDQFHVALVCCAVATAARRLPYRLAAARARAWCGVRHGSCAIDDLGKPY
jgi:hypothetical protein